MSLEERVWDRLRQVMDPELNINLVDLGLIYKVVVYGAETADGIIDEVVDRQTTTGKMTNTHDSNYRKTPRIFIQMTLTTPGCPLAAMFEPMIRESLLGLSLVDGTSEAASDSGDKSVEVSSDKIIDIERDVTIELTFDPPWVADMMSEEAKAELGMD